MGCKPNKARICVEMGDDLGVTGIDVRIDGTDLEAMLMLRALAMAFARKIVPNYTGRNAESLGSMDFRAMCMPSARSSTIEADTMTLLCHKLRQEVELVGPGVLPEEADKVLALFGAILRETNLTLEGKPFNAAEDAAWVEAYPKAREAVRKAARAMREG